MGEGAGGRTAGGSEAGERGAAGRQPEQLRRRDPRRPPALSRFAETSAGACPHGRRAREGEGRCSWRLRGVCAAPRARLACPGPDGHLAPPCPRGLWAQDADSERSTTPQSAEKRLAGASPRKPIHRSFLGCRSSSLVSERREGSWAKRLRLPQRRRCEENQKIMKCPLPEGL